jgi:hypothetical protein
MAMSTKSIVMMGLNRSHSVWVNKGHSGEGRVQLGNFDGARHWFRQLAVRAPVDCSAAERDFLRKYFCAGFRGRCAITEQESQKGSVGPFASAPRTQRAAVFNI